MRPNKYRLWLTCLVAFCGVAACLELGLRLILGLGHPVLFEVNPSFGSFPRPNQHLHRFFVDIATNEYGMRSGPAALDSRDPTYRILFVGDSVSYGTTYVDQKDILVEQIGTKLRERNFPAVVLNASSPGWAPANELGYLTQRGLYAADLVVLVYNTQDLAQRFTSYHPSALTPLENPSCAIAELWFRYLQPRILRSTPEVDPGSTGVKGPPTAADETQVLQTIEDTRKFVTDHGARFVILFSPARMDEVRQFQSDWDLALAHLKEWAQQREVPVIDMTALGAAHSVAELYFDGIHLRPAGDRLFAQGFVDWFLANPPPRRF